MKGWRQYLPDSAQAVVAQRAEPKLPRWLRAKPLSGLAPSQPEGLCVLVEKYEDDRVPEITDIRVASLPSRGIGCQYQFAVRLSSGRTDAAHTKIHAAAHAASPPRAGRARAHLPVEVQLPALATAGSAAGFPVGTAQTRGEAGGAGEPQRWRVPGVAVQEGCAVFRSDGASSICQAHEEGQAV